MATITRGGSRCPEKHMRGLGLWPNRAPKPLEGRRLPTPFLANECCLGAAALGSRVLGPRRLSSQAHVNLGGSRSSDRLKLYIDSGERK